MYLAPCATNWLHLVPSRLQLEYQCAILAGSYTTCPMSG